MTKPTKKRAAAKPEAVPAAAPTQVVNRKEMLARVAARADLRPNQVRAAYDALLHELGEALVRGENLRLPPLGILKVNRHKDLGDADMVICKLRRRKDISDDAAPLAAAAE